ncbi:MAG: hypothetical protein SFY81_00510 [Verrucomicrobiota bacterium]|nr:hypothetical protein [Verrucomicrobiota bacterium]
MSKRKRLRKLLQNQQKAASIAPAPKEFTPTSTPLSAPLITPKETSPATITPESVIAKLWQMLHDRLHKPCSPDDLLTCATAIEKLLKGKMAERKQSSVERKLTLAERKQDLAEKKFALAEQKRLLKSTQTASPSQLANEKSTNPEILNNSKNSTENILTLPSPLPSPSAAETPSPSDPPTAPTTQPLTESPSETEEQPAPSISKNPNYTYLPFDTIPVHLLA